MQYWFLRKSLFSSLSLNMHSAVFSFWSLEEEDSELCIPLSEPLSIEVDHQHCSVDDEDQGGQNAEHRDQAIQFKPRYYGKTNGKRDQILEAIERLFGISKVRQFKRAILTTRQSKRIGE